MQYILVFFIVNYELFRNIFCLFALLCPQKVPKFPFLSISAQNICFMLLHNMIFCECRNTMFFNCLFVTFFTSLGQNHIRRMTHMRRTAVFSAALRTGGGRAEGEPYANTVAVIISFLPLPRRPRRPHCPTVHAAPAAHADPLPFMEAERVRPARIRSARSDLSDRAAYRKPRSV